MKRLMMIAAALALTASSFALTGVEILQNVDRNGVYDTVQFQAQMKIFDGRRELVKSFSAWIKGDTKGYVEFTDPIESGTKILKLGDDMWLYIPGLETPQLIAGHMRSQGVVGSDFSYEDATENDNLTELYTVTLDGTETKNGKTCWKLTLIAKNSSVSYYKRIMWIDQATYIPIVEERYALSGRLLKTLTVSNIQKVGNYWVATETRIEDNVRAGRYTSITISNIVINQSVPDSYFSLSRLSH